MVVQQEARRGITQEEHNDLQDVWREQGDQARRGQEGGWNLAQGLAQESAEALELIMVRTGSCEVSDCGVSVPIATGISPGTCPVCAKIGAAVASNTTIINTIGINRLFISPPKALSLYYG